jgi:hypothetical protein
MKYASLPFTDLTKKIKRVLLSTLIGLFGVKSRKKRESKALEGLKLA